MDSIASQTYKDFEVIAVDNNCTDGTMAIIHSYQELNIKTVLCETQGIEAALNAGLRASSGKWIARQDGDDFWHPEKLDKQMEFLQNNPEVDILGTQIRLLDEKGNVQEQGTMGRKVRYPTDDSQIKTLILYGQNAICHPSVVFRNTLIHILGGYEKLFPLAEDLHFWLRAIPHFKFANLPDTLVDYTQKYDPGYDARVPQLAAKTYFDLYRNAGLVAGERSELVYDFEVDPNHHGNPRSRSGD